jgi:high-affinity Fe2+/Pb2+ permease
MRAIEEPQVQTATPPWVWPVLLLGAAVMVAWAWFIVGFLSEPSAVGRSRIVLLTSIAYSIAAALVGVIGAIGLARRERWGRTLAGIASAAMTFSVVGAIAGIPALIGIWSSRNSPKP